MSAPLKQLPKLVWELKALDKEFCKTIVNNEDKLWIHIHKNSAIISETDEASPETLFIVSMKNIKLKHLNRSEKIFYLLEPITYEEFSFDKVDLSGFNKFKDHMDQQSKLIHKYFNWNSYNTIDTGVKDADFWDMLVK